MSLNRTARLSAALAVLGLFAGGSLIVAQAPPRNGGKKATKANATPGAGVKAQAVFVKFPDWVLSVAFAPDSNLLAAGSYEVVKLFDVAEKQEIAALKEPAGYVKAVTFSKDGKTLATGSYQSLTLWDVASRKPIRKLKGHRGLVTGVAFSPDEKTLASASDDETVRLWDVATGEPRATFKGISQPALAIAYSPDGRFIATTIGDANKPTKKGSALVFDAAGNLLFTLEGHDRIVSALAFSPDSQTLATGSADESIKLWNLATGKEFDELEGHSRPVNSLAFFGDGKSLFSVCGGRAVGGNELKLWEFSTGKDLATVPAHDGPVNQLALSPNGRLLATASVDKSVKVWDVAAIFAAGGQAKTQAAGPKAPASDEFVPEPPALPEPADRVVATTLAFAGLTQAQAAADVKPLRVGIIGLDTSHAIAFTQMLNDPKVAEDLAGCRVVAAYPKGSPDIKSSTERVPKYTEQVKEMGVEIVESIDELLQKVDVVLLETNDGRPHFEQVLPVLKAGKTVFVDKPVAGSLTDAVAIYEAARHYKVPVFSSSSLRYTPSLLEIRDGKFGAVKGCDTYGTCPLEATHPDLFWYGIHGVESLFTVMGTGCDTVTRISTPGFDLVSASWKGGRVGSFRGIRTPEGGGKADYGGTVFCADGIVPIGKSAGYRPLLVDIIRFFRTGKAPVAEQETLEIYAFMEAADESKRQGGKPVTIESVMAKAREGAAKKVPK